MVQPSEGAEFWRSLDEALRRVPVQAQVRHNAFYSEAEWDVYEVRYTSLDDYPLFAWMSVPREQGPFPGLIVMPDYASAVSIPYSLFRYHAVVLNPSYRGQRRSDARFQARFPGLLTEGIEDSERYVMRGIFADAWRAVDFLASRSEVAGQPLALTGHGLGGTLALVAAALRPQIHCLAVETPLLFGSRGVVQLAGGYPLAEIADYLRTYPDRRRAVLATLGRFDVLPLAPEVRCPVLLSLGLQDRGLCPPPLGARLARRLESVQLHSYPQDSGEGGGPVHVVVRSRWLRGQLGLPTTLER